MPTRVRFLVLVLLGLAAASAYLTRVIPAAVTSIQNEHDFTNEQMGWIIAGFALGYAISQIPGGYLGNVLGLRLAFPLLAFSWSLCCLWFSQASSYHSMYYSRIALGLAQGGLVPCCAKALADWFPDARRGIGSSVVAMSMQIGGVAAIGLTAQLLPALGWRAVFASYSLTGIVWSIAFFLLYRNRPEAHPWTNHAECDLIHEIPTVSSESRISPTEDPRNVGEHGWPLVVAMFLSLSMWAVCVQAFFKAFSYAFFTSWFPAYLERSRGVHVLEAGLLGTTPVIGSLVGSLLGGLIVDFLFARTASKWISRSGTAVVSLTLCAVITFAAAWAADPTTATLLISAGSLCAAISGPANWAAVLDISGRHTALVIAVMNLVGAIGDYLCPILVGTLFTYIEQAETAGAPTSRWNLVLYLFTSVNLAAALAWLFLNPNRLAVVRYRKNSPAM